MEVIIGGFVTVTRFPSKCRANVNRIFFFLNDWLKKIWRTKDGKRNKMSWLNELIFDIFHPGLKAQIENVQSNC